MPRTCCLMIVLSLLLSGCGSGDPIVPAHEVMPDDSAAAPAISAESGTASDTESASVRTETKSDEATASAPGQASEKVPARENVQFKNGPGERLYEIKFKGDGAKLVDPQEQELARFNVDGGKLKVKLPDDSVVAYIVAKEGELQIRDASQEVELFELKSQPDGDWKLKDAQDHVLAVIKRRDYGYEIEDGTERSLFKSKLKDGKYSLRNAADETVLYTKDRFSPLSVACLGLEQIESLPIRSGLAVAVLLLVDAD